MVRFTLTSIPCMFLVSACGGAEEYDAFKTAGGPSCGVEITYDWDGQQSSTPLACLPGDKCIDENAASCECVKSCDD